MSQENSHQENRTYGSIQNNSISTNIITGDITENDSLLSQTAHSSTTIQSTTDQMLSTLSIGTKIGFGLGHIYNDLCAGIWFSYTLLFMQGALTMPGTEAGGLMMLGQVGDAIATPIFGYLIDKFGTKQKWHILGKLKTIPSMIYEQ